VTAIKPKIVIYLGLLIVLSIATVVFFMWGADRVPISEITAADGDTILIGSQLIRLANIDAPELGQVAVDLNTKRYDIGEISHAKLKEVLSEYIDVLCVAVKSDDATDIKKDEYFATCDGRFNGQKEDIGKRMVLEGMATGMYGDSAQTYAAAQQQAQLLNSGVWGKYQTWHPYDYRKAMESARDNELFVELGVDTSAAKIKVIDGDSLELKAKKVRLAGVDAPELGQLGYVGSAFEDFMNSYDVGIKTRDALKNAIYSDHRYLFLECEIRQPKAAIVRDMDPGETTIATCYGLTPDSREDIAQWLVASGMAWSVAQQYRDSEDIARGLARNIWDRRANIRDLPWTYRKKYKENNERF